MAAIDKFEAIERLENAVRQSDRDDMVEYYKELFPVEAANGAIANADREFLLNKVIAHFKQGLEEEEIQDLWHVVFPKLRHARFDDMDGLLHYQEREDPWAISIDE